MRYVYIVRSKSDAQLYVGSTNDLKRRVAEHNRGIVEVTRGRRPFELEAYLAVKNEATARALEKYLKSGSGMATLRRRLLAV